jgi:hypothetical protein
VNTRTTVTVDGETTVHIPLTFRRAWRAEADRDLGRRGMGAAAAGRQRNGQALDTGVHAPLEDLARAKSLATSAGFHG